MVSTRLATASFGLGLMVASPAWAVNSGKPKAVTDPEIPGTEDLRMFDVSTPGHVDDEPVFTAWDAVPLPSLYEISERPYTVNDVVVTAPEDESSGCGGVCGTLGFITFGAVAGLLWGYRRSTVIPSNAPPRDDDPIAAPAASTVTPVPVNVTPNAAAVPAPSVPTPVPVISSTKPAHAIPAQAPAVSTPLPPQQEHPDGLVPLEVSTTLAPSAADRAMSAKRGSSVKFLQGLEDIMDRFDSEKDSPVPTLLSLGKFFRQCIEEKYAFDVEEFRAAIEAIEELEGIYKQQLGGPRADPEYNSRKGWFISARHDLHRHIDLLEKKKRKEKEAEPAPELPQPPVVSAPAPRPPRRRSLLGR